jgi:hypothetical protein
MLQEVLDIQKREVFFANEGREVETSTPRVRLRKPLSKPRPREKSVCHASTDGSYVFYGF